MYLKCLGYKPHKTDPLNSSEGPFGGPRTSLWNQLLQKGKKKIKMKHVEYVQKHAGYLFLLENKSEVSALGNPRRST